MTTDSRVEAVATVRESIGDAIARCQREHHLAVIHRGVEAWREREARRCIHGAGCPAGPDCPTTGADEE